MLRTSAMDERRFELKIQLVNFFQMSSQVLTILQCLAADVAIDHGRLKMHVSHVTVNVAFDPADVVACSAVKNTVVLNPDHCINIAVTSDMI